MCTFIAGDICEKQEIFAVVIIVCDGEVFPFWSWVMLVKKQTRSIEISSQYCFSAAEEITSVFFVRSNAIAVPSFIIELKDVMSLKYYNIRFTCRQYKYDSPSEKIIGRTIIQYLYHSVISAEICYYSVMLNCIMSGVQSYSYMNAFMHIRKKPRYAHGAQ